MTVFDCTRNAGLKLTMSKNQIGVEQVHFLGRIITSDGVAPQAKNVKEFLVKTTTSKIQKGSSTVYRILELSRQLHSAITVLQTPQRNHQILCTHKFSG